MKKINLTQGKVALVDDRDYERMSAYTWHATKNRHNWYAATRMPKARGGRIRYMHRLILNATPVQEVDHINHNTLDNQHSNLRIASRSENGRNRPKQLNNSSGFKGVSNWPDGRWQAGIKLQGKRIGLGLFNRREDAARAYDAAALRLHGKFAYLNFPKEGNVA